MNNSTSIMIRRTSSGYQRRIRNSSFSADESSTSPGFGRIRFPRKLYDAANSGSGVIRWSEDGTSIIVSERTFERHVMSRHRGLVKISSFANFRRQLRCYSFHWRRRKNRDMFEFTHPSFVRGRPELLDGMVPGSGVGVGDGSTARRVGRKLAMRPRGRPRKIHLSPLPSETPPGTGRRKPSGAVNVKLIFQDLYEPGVKEDHSSVDSAEQIQTGADPEATGSARFCLVPDANMAASCCSQLWPRRMTHLGADPWGPTEECSSDGEDVDNTDDTRRENTDVWEPDGTLPATSVLLESSLVEVIATAKSENDYALYGAPRVYVPDDDALQLPDRDDGYTLTVL